MPKTRLKPNRNKFEQTLAFETAAPGEKIWDKLKITKDEFFVRKYGNITPERRKKLDNKVLRQRKLREARRIHELGEDYKKEPAPKLVLNSIAEYVFGTHAVLGALTAGKRNAFGRIYVQNSKKETSKILQLGKRYGVKVVEKTKGELNMLCSNGVHNGVVLESRPLEFPMVESLGKCDASGEYVLNMVDENSNGTVLTQCAVARDIPDSQLRFPMGIYLDGITDPQNLGNIIRSAYYLGADFIVIPESESARLGPVAAKAAAGALDMMPIYRVEHPMQFTDKARTGGWNVISTSSKTAKEDLEETNGKHQSLLEGKYIDFSDLPGLMSTAPMLLIFGSEGAGVRTNLKFRSDYLVGLTKGRPDPEGVVDSLNVGTAVGLLIGKCFE